MIEEGATICSTGRRKSSVARVRVSRGSGQVKINSRDLEVYFPVERRRSQVLAPLKATKSLGKFDVTVNVKGGGPTGQAGAVMLGLARALQQVGDDIAEILRDGGYLTRDSRMVERKKYGRRGARRGFQFSKR
jgi:small subunit ribosomal protein S9